MAVTSFQDLPLADRDHDWDGDAAEKRVREWAGAEDGPNEKYRDAHVWYDADKKDNFTAYKLLIADVVDGKLRAVPARRDGRRQRHGRRARRGGPAGKGCRSRQEPPREVLQEDGRRGALGARLTGAPLAQFVRCPC